jgi:hypothetical protein
MMAINVLDVVVVESDLEMSKRKKKGKSTWEFGQPLRRCVVRVGSKRGRADMGKE